MEYSYQTRYALWEEYRKAWEEKNQPVLTAFSEERRNLLEEIMGSRKLEENTPSELSRAIKQYRPGVRPSDFIRGGYADMVRVLVPEEYQEDYYYIIDQFNRFQYSTGYERRSVRTADYVSFLRRIFGLMECYRRFGFFGCTLADYILDNLTPELIDYKENNYYRPAPLDYLDNILAARIDQGDAKVIQAIRNIILSENNTTIVTTDIIRAIVKSSDPGLHRLLGDFLLAARLQEGIRQAICENADCGTAEAFLVILDVIQKHDLIRFAAVKRAIATWTGICSHEHIDRITAKILEDMVAAVHNKDKAYELTRTNDSVHIMIGLWALGFYEIFDAISVMRGYVEDGSRNQLLTMSYYNLSLHMNRFKIEVSKRMMEKYGPPEDHELVAAFLPTYLKDINSILYYRGGDKPPQVPITQLFSDREEGYRHFEIMKKLYEGLKGQKKRLFSPCIFPWYEVELGGHDLVVRMTVTAHALEDDQLVDYVSQELASVSATSGSDRSRCIHCLLYEPRTPLQRQALLHYAADKETYTRKTAFDLIRKLSLEPEELLLLESFLRYKNQDIRGFVLEMLGQLTGEALYRCAERLVRHSTEEMRAGGLDLIFNAKKAAPDAELMARLTALAGQMEQPTAREQILIEEIVGHGKTDEILNRRGYGLYDPEVELSCPETGDNLKTVNEYFRVPKQDLDRLIEKLTDFVNVHKMKEYRSVEGEELLLANGLSQTYRKRGIPLYETYPFPELWQEFYETEIKDTALLMNLDMALHMGLDKERAEDYETYRKYEKEIVGAARSEYIMPHNPHPQLSERYRTVRTIVRILINMYAAELPFRVAAGAVRHIIRELPDEALWYLDTKRQSGQYSYVNGTPGYAFINSDKMKMFNDRLRRWENDQEFAVTFYLFYGIDKRFGFIAQNIAALEKESYYLPHSYCRLTIFHYIKAYRLKLITADLVYKAVFEEVGLPRAVMQLSTFAHEKLTEADKYLLGRIYETDMQEDGMRKVDRQEDVMQEDDRQGSDRPGAAGGYWQTGLFFYENLINTILDVELKRGDTPTVFSKAVSYIDRISGIDRLINILKAMGTDKLDRKTYYGSHGSGRRECFSHLLQVCYPLETDHAGRLREALEGSGIKEARLIEAAMYAPQWLDIVEEYLGYAGFKSGCYYFAAHMNERFDERKQAMIAKYTPLSVEDLNRGAFDNRWFYEVYEVLGDKLFQQLYASAKYLSDGSKHARARKYADAALGKAVREELEAEIVKKRNKDLLMSYGILPVKDRADMLHRYEFLQQFRKESRQFGALRKASEEDAFQMGLKNMASAAGYADASRLILAMETELVKENRAYLEWQTVNEYEIKVGLRDAGVPELLLRKGEKNLKSIPAVLKKDAAVLAIKDFQKKLKDQHARTVKMLEQAMEEEESYSFGELCRLCENPVIRAIIVQLVFVGEDMDGFIRETAGYVLTDCDGREYRPDAEALLKVAHPYDLYWSGKWHRYQQHLFERYRQNGIKQPFKQVFRELYVKLAEELEKEASLMFAGNQIQPKKTVACLQGRKWIADYEEGLQKVFYGKDIIARIYAIADWFSPSEVEAPTLEWVEFSGRKTFQAIKIKDIPDIIYSEVMRDVDLAVSVAHAGGVDPETSHSTVEMRKVVAEFNRELFQLKNVSFEKNHAVITGLRGEYTIHMGSGVIHQLGGHQINVLPVHSQARGKIFLPFVDEDPKSAEIMSKILLFAEDGKIKDPYILSQLVKGK